MESAINGSTTRAGRETTSKIARDRVTAWATVNALTCQTRGRSRAPSRNRPSTNRMWSIPRGRMWTNPRRRYRPAADHAPGGAAGPDNGNRSLRAPRSSRVWRVTPRRSSRMVRFTSANERDAKNSSSVAPAGTAPVRRAVRPSTVGIADSVAADAPWSGNDTSKGAGSPSKRSRTRRWKSRRNRSTAASSSAGDSPRSAAASSASSALCGAPSASASRSTTRSA